jgi:hypothetical protein
MTMRNLKPGFRHALFLGVTLAAAGVSWATIPEPDAVVYGQLYHRFSQPLIPALSGELTVVAQVNGATLATTIVPPGTNRFLLRIPMDDGLEPRQPNTAKGGDQVRVLILNNQTRTRFECVQSSSQLCTLPAGRAPVVSMNLTIAGNVAGVAPDSNGDAIPDYWGEHYQLDSAVTGGNQDTDEDGMSNLEEFIAGTDPTNAASLFTLGTSVATDPIQGQQLSLTFSPAFTDRSYSVLAGNGPGGPWVEQQTIRPALSEPQTVDLPILPNVAARYFRVSILH